MALNGTAFVKAALGLLVVPGALTAQDTVIADRRADNSPLMYSLVGSTGLVVTGESGVGVFARGGVRATWSRFALTLSPLDIGEMEVAQDPRYRGDESACVDTETDQPVAGRFCEVTTKFIGAVSGDVIVGLGPSARFDAVAGLGYRLIESPGPFVLGGVQINRPLKRIVSLGMQARLGVEYFDLGFGMEFRLSRIPGGP